jgi:hypothetical protein
MCITVMGGIFMSVDTTWLDWSDRRLLPAFQAPEHLDVYDIGKASHDIQLTVTTMAGIVNRQRPRVYLIGGGDEHFWLKESLHGIPQKNTSVSGDAVLPEMLKSYRDSIRGLIIYDPALEDTINVATTLAGLRDGIVVAPGQVQELQAGFGLPILSDLRSHGWRTRYQAYQWAQQNLLSSTSPRLLAGLAPENVSGLRSFLVATRTFVYWLDSRIHISFGAPTERSLMQQIVGTFRPGALHLGWFIDEGSGVSITSRAAMAVLASDYCQNLEVWASIRSSPPFVSHEARQLPAPGKKVYVSFTISDGDNLQYCQHRMLRLWHDSARGSFPLGWTFSPLLIQSVPSFATYYLRTATENDELVAGPSGIAYMFPSYWPAEQLDTFLECTGVQAQTMGMKTLTVLDSNFWRSLGLPFSNVSFSGGAIYNREHQRRFVSALSPYGIRGVLSGAGSLVVGWRKIGDVPVYRNLGLASSVSMAVKMIKWAAWLRRERPLFLNLYILAWMMGPSQLKQVIEQLGNEYEVVLPSTLLAMLAKTI